MVAGDTMHRWSAHGHQCPPGSSLCVLVERRWWLCRGARVGTAVAVPEPFVTAGLRFPLALQQRHRDACSRSPHNMFALISQLPPDSPRCRAPRRRGGRSVPAKPRRAGSPGGNWHGRKGLETVVRPDATRADKAGNTTAMGKGCSGGSPCPSTLTQAVPQALGRADRGTGLAVTPVCHCSHPAPHRAEASATHGVKHIPPGPHSQ